MSSHVEPGTPDQQRVVHQHGLHLVSRESLDDANEEGLSTTPEPPASVHSRSHVHDHNDHAPTNDAHSSRTVSADEKHPVKNEQDLEAAIPKDDAPLYVEFSENDPRDPFSFSTAKKWKNLIVACLYTGDVAATASTYAIGEGSMVRDLHTSRLGGAAGLATFTVGFAVFPLVFSPWSEEFGRKPMYLFTCFFFTVMFIPIALSVNIEMVIIFRFIQGAFASTGATMVGGTVADLFRTHERGTPMAVYSAAVLVAIGGGAVIAGWIEGNPNLEWRWIQWIHLIVSGVFTLALPFIMDETRGSVILIREARKLRKDTGDNRYRARIEDTMPTMKQLIYISCTRSIYLLFTEPVVLAFSLWIGFVWGVLYGLLQSISFVFKELYGFGPGELGSVFGTIVIGTILGFLSNFWQEKIYREKVATEGPEARLYSACIGAIVCIVGTFIYAWTSYPFVHWIAPCIGITLIIWGLFMIYLAVFNYLADAYLMYASSALSGQAFLRNMMAAVFPLFVTPMYHNLGFTWASTLFGCISVLLAFIPFVLFKWGPVIRSKSKFAKELAAKNQGK